ncbi:hypothetical protein DPMN_010188 [Dreissena polymorpha]|uniref:Pacifastin domain-containing protein n=1 Tax=Dreissena polymorpha TaxID=45954 RepID=A0A9D4S1A9_DREPO|nr:hypothetical protein DPMN_010188 [Dreissena polymorpha]
MKAAFLCIMVVSVVVSVAIAYKEPCINNGQEYAHEVVFLDADCNKCQCNDGNTVCEMNA